MYDNPQSFSARLPNCLSNFENAPEKRKRTNGSTPEFLSKIDGFLKMKKVA
jgi:hypothetical protein